MIDRRQFFGLAAAALLAACASDAPISGPVPEIGFQHLTPIRLTVSHIERLSEYQSPLKAPNAEHLFTTSPQRAMRNWSSRRLVPVGGPGSGAVAKFVIEDASVIETKLDTTKGLKGMLTYEPSERYDATATARLSIEDVNNGHSGEIRVTATRSVEVRENATLAEREKAWFDMTEALMRDFNTQMEQEIQGYLARWLETPGLK